MIMCNLVGNVFDIKRFATHDGVGIRTTVFLKGCPLRCVWCQNPEGLKSSRQVLYMESKCIHCQSCMTHVKHGGVKKGLNRQILNRDAHEDWEAIVDACPCAALQFDASAYSVDALLEEVLKDEAFFAREGGVTLSGGEPFLQADFLIAFLKVLKERNIHTAIETSLYTSLDNVKKVLPYVDQIYADLKLFDSELHKIYTGVENEQIKENIAYLLTSDKKDCVTIRTPLIPDMSASDDNIAEIASYLSHLDGEVKYELLNYNPLAKAKYSYLDMEYCFDENPKLFSKDAMQHYYEIAKTNGIKHLIIE